MGKADRQRLVELARKRGFSDLEILTEALRNAYGGNARRRIVVEWGEALGMSSTDALRLAFSGGLIPSVHEPRDDEEPS